MDWTVKVTDLVIIFATLLGPVFAVQTQKWIERQRAVRDRRERIFRTLMATRVTNLSAGHVEALNSVPLEFYGRTKKIKPITNSWRMYHAHLNSSGADTALWNKQRASLYLDLLMCIAEFLGYEFDKAQIEREVYFPQGHAAAEADQETIRRGLAKLLSGEMALPLDVRSMAVDEEMRSEDYHVRRLLRAWLIMQTRGQTSSPTERPSPP